MDAWEHEKDPVARVRLYLVRYTVELIVLSILAVCSTHFFVGRYLNKRLAHQWL